jgi:hypothetical protein
MHVTALSTYLDGSSQGVRCACLEVGLVDASILPALACLLGDTGTPVVHGRVFGLSALPDAPLQFGKDVGEPGPLHDLVGDRG